MAGDEQERCRLLGEGGWFLVVGLAEESWGEDHTLAGKGGVCSLPGHRPGIILLGPACFLGKSSAVFLWGALLLLGVQLLGEQSRASLGLKLGQ